MKRINDLIQLSVPVLRRPCSDAPEADYRGDWGPQHPQDGPASRPRTGEPGVRQGRSRGRAWLMWMFTWGLLLRYSKA